MSPRLLHAYIATAPRSNAAPSLAFTDESGRRLDRIPLDGLPRHTAGRPDTAAPARLQLLLLVLEPRQPAAECATPASS